MLLWQAGVGGTKGTREISIAEARTMGFQVIIYSVNTLWEGIRAVRAFYQRLKLEGKATYNVEDVRETAEFVLRLDGLQRYWEIEARTTEKPA